MIIWLLIFQNRFSVKINFWEFDWIDESIKINFEIVGKLASEGEGEDSKCISWQLININSKGGNIENLTFKIFQLQSAEKKLKFLKMNYVTRENFLQYHWDMGTVASELTKESKSQYPQCMKIRQWSEQRFIQK